MADIFKTDNRVRDFNTIANAFGINARNDSYEKFMHQKGHWGVYRDPDNSGVFIGIHLDSDADLHVRGFTGGSLKDYVPQIINLAKRVGSDSIYFATNNARIVQIVRDSGIVVEPIGQANGEQKYRIKL